MSEAPHGMHRVQVGSQSVDLPLVQLRPGLSVALMITVDRGVRFGETVGRELAELVAPTAPDVVVSTATMGIPVAIEVSRALGLDDYLILQKTNKLHLQDALSEPVDSITSRPGQAFLLDRARVPAVAGRRVVLVDDVISTGASAVAALRLLERAGADVVGIAAVLTEGDGWREALGPRASEVRALGHLPLFGDV